MLDKYKLYQWQKEIVYNLNKGNNISVNAPPGSGKTLPGILYIRDLITYHNNGKIFWLVPYKALANDKFIELSEIFGYENVGLMTGDRKLNTDAKIIVSIYESFKNRIDKYKSIKFIVCDEIHTINERDNIDLTFKLLRDRKIQYYAISGSFKDLNIYCFDSIYYNIIDIDNNYSIPKEIIVQSRLVIDSHNFVKSLMEKYQVLVFRFSISKIQTEILNFASFLSKFMSSDIVEYNFDDKILDEVVKYRIGYYVSTLSDNDKFKLAKLYNKGFIKCLYCTDSIATGVNLPADVIVLRDTKKYYDNKYQYIDQNLLVQLYGRVGRIGKSKNALIYIPDDKDLPKYFKNPKQQNILNIKHHIKYYLNKIIK